MEFDLFLATLKEAGLTRNEFVSLSGTNEDTFRGWATKRQGRKVPYWVQSWLNLYINNKKKDIAIEILKR